MGDIYYNAVNRAGADKSREVRGPLLVEVLAADRRDSTICSYRIGDYYYSIKVSYVAYIH
jgi:hypothetical protein